MGFTFFKQSHQIDRYYLSGKIINGRNIYLRIREDVLRHKFSLDFHEVISDLATKETELELNNENAQKMAYVLVGLGLQLLCIVNKQRQEYLLDDAKLVVDQVENLGKFVELEIEGQETMENQLRLDHLAAELGLCQSDRVDGKGYPDLLMNK